MVYVEYDYGCLSWNPTLFISSCLVSLPVYSCPSPKKKSERVILWFTIPLWFFSKEGWLYTGYWFQGLNISPWLVLLGHVIWGEKCGLDKNRKIKAICPNFWLGISGTLNVGEKQFTLLAFVLVFTGKLNGLFLSQVKSIVFKSEALPLSNYRKILIT